jgi:hypothetical protein
MIAYSEVVIKIMLLQDEASSYILSHYDDSESTNLLHYMEANSLYLMHDKLADLPAPAFAPASAIAALTSSMLSRAPGRDSQCAHPEPRQLAGCIAS